MRRLWDCAQNTPAARITHGTSLCDFQNARFRGLGLLCIQTTCRLAPETLSVHVLSTSLQKSSLTIEDTTDSRGCWCRIGSFWSRFGFRCLWLHLTGMTGGLLIIANHTGQLIHPHTYGLIILAHRHCRLTGV